MLGIRRIKLHGMQDERWCTKDKITQYKCLINLYNRDGKVMRRDTAIRKRKENAYMKRVTRDICMGREELDNAVRGDRQRIRNFLRLDRKMQLAYQNLPLENISGHISQDLFKSRKDRDRLEHVKRLRTEKLIALKLEVAKLEDRVKFDIPNDNPSQITSTIITGKVQDAILRTDAAIIVNSIYKDIIQDAIYFDALLRQLKNDVQLQSKCMLRTIQLGQLATEYLDDRKDDFRKRQAAAQCATVIQTRQLDEVRVKVKTIHSHLRHTLKKDEGSFTNMTKKGKKSQLFPLYVADVAYLESLFHRLQEVTKTTDYSAIYPCIVKQSQITNTFKNVLSQRCKQQDRMLNKNTHARAIAHNYTYAMNDTLAVYKRDKAELLKALDEEETKIATLRKDTHSKLNVTSKIQMALKDICSYCRIVRPDVKMERKKPISSQQELELEGINMLEALEEKLASLINLTNLNILEGPQRDRALSLYENLLVKPTEVVEMKITTEDLTEIVESIMIEDTNVPTRGAIKQLSKDIVGMGKIRMQSEQLEQQRKALERYESIRSKGKFSRAKLDGAI